MYKKVNVLTCIPGMLTDLVDFVWLDRSFFSAVIFQLKLSAFVQSTAKVCFPLRRVGFIHTCLIFPCLQSPRLEDTEQGLMTFIFDFN